jgi:hypothetical protein
MSEISEEILARILDLETRISDIESKISGNLISRFEIQRLRSELDLVREEQFQLQKMLRAFRENGKTP